MTDIEETEFVAFDLETTGLHPIACRIVEIGAIRFRGDGEVMAKGQKKYAKAKRYYNSNSHVSA
jgi:DNA polymerase III epsilon subunit-like protein